MSDLVGTQIVCFLMHRVTCFPFQLYTYLGKYGTFTLLIDYFCFFASEALNCLTLFLALSCVNRCSVAFCCYGGVLTKQDCDFNMKF